MKYSGKIKCLIADSFKGEFSLDVNINNLKTEREKAKRNIFQNYFGSIVMVMIGRKRWIKTLKSF